MNPETPGAPREEMETWLTSLLLGELSEGEAAAVRELIKHDPELAKLHDELKSTIQLVRDASAKAAEPTASVPDQSKLSSERREKLLAQFKTVTPKEFTPEKRRNGIRLLELAAVLAILAILSAMLLPALSKAKSKAQSVSVLNNLRQLEMAKERWALENKVAGNSTPTFDDIKPYLGRGEMPSVAGETYVLGAVGEPPSAEVAAVDAKKTFRRWTANLPAGGRDDRVRLFADGKAYSINSSALGAKEVSERKPADNGLTTVTFGGLGSSATKTSANESAQNLNYHSLSAGAQDYSLPAPTAATPPPATPIVLPTMADTDSPNPVGQNYAVTAAVEQRPHVDRKVQVSEQLGAEPEWIGAPEKSAQSQTISDASVYRYAGGAASPAPGMQTPAQQSVVDPATGLPVTATVNGGAIGIGNTESLDQKASHQDTEGLGTAFRSRYVAAADPLAIPRVSVVGGAGGGGAGPTNPNLGDDISETPPKSAGIYLSDSAVDEGKSLSLDRGGRTPGVAADGTDQFEVANRTQTLPEATPKVKLQGVTTLSGPEKQILSLGDTSTVGRFHMNSSLRGYYDDSAVTEGGRLTPESNVYSLDIGGNATIPTQAGVSGNLPAKEAKPRENTPQPLLEQEEYGRYKATILEREGMYAEQQKQLEQLNGLDKAQLREKLPQLTSDAELTETVLGVKLAEQKLATLQKNFSTPALELQRAQGQVDELKKKADSRAAGVMTKLETQSGMLKSEVESLKDSIATAQALEARKLGNARAYYDKKRELDDMVDFRRLLTRKMNLEGADLNLPKSSQVEIVELAEAKSAPSQTLWGTVRSAVSGDVERAARIKMERDKSDIAELSGARGARDANPYDPYFLQTEFEIIQSEAVLGKVVSQLGLDKTWAKNSGAGDKLSTSEAVSLLRKHLDLRGVPNTSLIEIRAKADKPDEAARIANAVAEAYRQWRLDTGRELVASGLAGLEERSEEQDEKIRHAQQELEVLGKSAGIETDLPMRKAATNAPIPQPEIQTSENNFSTFSLNVSDVSFKLAAASLEKGQMPDVASIRSEEFINAFDYRDPEPLPGAPIAFAYERARYPFAHNRDLLRFSLKTAAAGRQAGRPLNIVLLLDNSGSMERADRVQIIREALRVLAGQLQPQDKLSVITFARTPRLVADDIAGDKAGEVTEAVSGLTPEGGTNLEEAMNLAYQTAARHYLIGGINRVVLLTDGAANLGDVEPASLKQKVEDARKQGIALDCFGIGWEGLNDDLLEVLSRNGDGRYGFINSPEEAATDFVGQLAGALKVAASDVKVQVEFNPKRVTTYRQIGYARHQLTKEQFRDNTVDAAEIAAQEAGNALYTVEVNPAGSGPIATVRVRYKIPGTTDYREQAWDVPFTGNALSLEQASPAMRLAASAAAFSEWLVASPFAGEVSPDGVLNVLRGVPEVFGADSRPKTLEWMIRQAKSLEGK